MSNASRLTITISDPWELGELLKWQPISGELVQLVNDQQGGRALVKLEGPIQYRGIVCRYVIASPRHEGGAIVDLASGKSIACAITGITDQQAESANPFDLSVWRGGVGFIGDVAAAKKS